MVIPQVFGSSSVLYRVGAPLFVIMLFVSALLRTGRRLARSIYCWDRNGRFQKLFRLRRLRLRLQLGKRDMGSMPHIAYLGTVRYHTVRCRKRRRPPVIKLGAVTIASKAATRYRSGTLVGAHRARPAPIKRGCPFDVRRAQSTRNTFHALL